MGVSPFLETDFPTMANFNAAFERCAIIKTGSYVGTGTYGKNNQNSIEFDIPPKIVVIIASKTESNISTTQNCVGIWVDGAMCMIPDDLYICLSPYENGKISWYHPNGAAHQLNNTGYTYCYTSFS